MTVVISVIQEVLLELRIGVFELLMNCLVTPESYGEVGVELIFGIREQ